MTLSSTIRRQFTHEQLNAREAQNMAHIISFGPVIFQTARLMIKYGIFEMLNQSAEGLTEIQIAGRPCSLHRTARIPAVCAGAASVN